MGVRREGPGLRLTQHGCACGGLPGLWGTTTVVRALPVAAFDSTSLSDIAPSPLAAAVTDLWASLVADVVGGTSLRAALAPDATMSSNL